MGTDNLLGQKKITELLGTKTNHATSQDQKKSHNLLQCRKSEKVGNQKKKKIKKVGNLKLRKSAKSRKSENGGNWGKVENWKK